MVLFPPFLCSLFLSTSYGRTDGRQRQLNGPEQPRAGAANGDGGGGGARGYRRRLSRKNIIVARNAGELHAAEAAEAKFPRSRMPPPSRLQLELRQSTKGKVCHAAVV